MSHIDMETEPVAIIGAVSAVISAGVALAVGFGLNLTGEQVALLMTLVGAIGFVVQLIWVRPKVFSPDAVRSDFVARNHPSVGNVSGGGVQYQFTDDNQN